MILKLIQHVQFRDYKNKKSVCSSAGHGDSPSARSCCVLSRPGPRSQGMWEEIHGGRYKMWMQEREGECGRVTAWFTNLLLVHQDLKLWKTIQTTTFAPIRGDSSSTGLGGEDWMWLSKKLSQIDLNWHLRNLRSENHRLEEMHYFSKADCQCYIGGTSRKLQLGVKSFIQFLS